MRGDEGSVTVELVIIMPVLIAFLFFMVMAGRLTDARSDVVSAAADAARAASLQDSAAAARSEAQAAATATVAGERLNCATGPTVTTTFDPAFQAGATVHVEVTCTVDTSDLTFIGLPLSVTMQEEAWEPIDAHRSL